MKYNINSKTVNIIKNFEQDKSYFFTPNQFHIKSVKIGPFLTDRIMFINIQDFMNGNIKPDTKHKTEMKGNDYYSRTVLIKF